MVGTSTSRGEQPGWAGGMAGLAFGSQSIMFSTGGEGDGEKEPGEGEVSVLVLLWGGRDYPFTCVRRYQAPICSTRSMKMSLGFCHTDGHPTGWLFAGG